MDTQTEDSVGGEETSSPKRKGRTLPVEQHYFRFERQRNMLSDEDQTSLERDRQRLRERQRRQNMTDEQKLLERERRRLRDEQRRRSMSDEQRALEKERRRNRERQRRNNMNDEQKAKEMERRRNRERQHRQDMDDERKSKDKERRRERDRQRRENMSDEQRAQERERRRLYEQQKRGSLSTSQFLMTQINQLSGGAAVEQDNQNASYSTDLTDGSQTLALTEDNMQVDSTNTSNSISVDVLDLKEGTILINSGNLLGQNVTHSTEAIDCNATRAHKHANLRVNVPNTSELSSSTTLNSNKVTLIPCTGEPVAGAHNVSYSTGLTDGNEVSVHMQDNLIVEATPISECSSATTLDLNENAVAAYNGHENVDIYIEGEGDAAQANAECGNNSKT